MKIDLQMHTTYSDGHNTPEELAKLAHEGGLAVISVTDHDRLDSIEPLAKACEPYGIKNIPGVEISTTHEGKVLHVLGYNIDYKNEELAAFLRNINQYRQQKFIEQFQRLNDALKAAGKREADIEKYRNKDARYYSYPGTSRFLFEEGIIENTEEGFQYLKEIKGTVPQVEVSEACKMIHQAGGIAVMSHPFAPRISFAAISPDRGVQETFVAKFKKDGIDGLECYQAGHNADDVKFCLEMAEKYELIITAGSDWHGYHGPEDKGIREYLPYYINALGDLEVPEDKVAEIVSKFI